MNQPATKNNSIKPFGCLDPYAFRVLVVRNAKDYAEAATAICDSLNLEKLPLIQEDTFTVGNVERTFKFISLPGKPPIYTMFLQNRDVGVRRILDIFELGAHLKTPGLVYVTYSAIPLFKLSVFKNVRSILLHDLDEIKSYFAKNIIGNDEQEVLYSLRQDQTYCTEQFKSRKEFAKIKKDKQRPAKQPIVGATAVNLGEDTGRGEFNRRREKAAPTKQYKAALENPISNRSNGSSKASSWNLPVDVAFTKSQSDN